MLLAVPGRMNHSFDAESDTSWPVDLLGRIGKAVRLLLAADAGFSVTVGGDPQSSRMRIKDAQSLPQDLVSGLALCEVLRDLVYRAGQPIDLKFRVQDLVPIQQELKFAAAAVNPMFSIESFSLGPESVANADQIGGKEVDAFLCPYVSVGGKTI